MIRFISTEDTLPLRSRVLRDGAPPDSCYFQGDDSPDTFHMGYVSSQQGIICVLSCQPETMDGYEGLGYRLRGMATHPDWRGKGIGSLLLDAAIDHLTTVLMADYLWCNARRAAYDFYLHLGFSFLSEEFEIPGIGPHKVMFRRLG
ncbi:GNAT family N-acetyltransferase [Parapedobacter sp. DT-150]|uniref:GNAT family N-acetyltransferase n=1 Tax=Parapedobacter sp. DT-150 TaxID=3396162 RepID=UPI003F19EB15